MMLSWLLFSPKGRIDRQTYLAAVAAQLVALPVAFVTLALVSAVAGDAGLSAEAAFVVGAVPYVIAAVWAWVATSIKRLHDIGKSWWWMAIVLIPGLGSLWHFAELVFTPGDPGDNRFGPQGGMPVAVSTAGGGAAGVEEIPVDAAAVAAEIDRRKAAEAHAAIERAVARARSETGGRTASGGGVVVRRHGASIFGRPR